jgi:DNA-directed RNA polymerase subunit N
MTCGKPVSQFWEEYKKRVSKGEDPKAVLDDMGIERYCCRSLFLTHIDLTAKIARFKK